MNKVGWLVAAATANTIVGLSHAPFGIGDQIGSPSDRRRSKTHKP
ncbi:hypothetical protein ABIE44_003230 [Marmoricola sp. OAE513]